MNLREEFLNKLRNQAIEAHGLQAVESADKADLKITAHENGLEKTESEAVKIGDCEIVKYTTAVNGVILDVKYIDFG